jgi:hypothetical protein
MSAERSAGLVLRWVAVYTRGLPADVRQDRRDEIADDLWSQKRDAAESGRGDRSVGGEILARLLLGIPADVGWRVEQRGAGVRRAPAANPTTGSRVVAVLAILGGIGWLTAPPLQSTYGEAGWADPATAWLMMLSFLGGTWALAGAMFALVVGNQARIRGWVAALSLIGALLAALSVLGPLGAIIAMPVGSAALLWELGMVGAVSARVSRSHVAVAVLLSVPIIATLASPALLSTVGAPLVILILAYAASWIAIGWSLRHAGSMQQEPAPRD